MTTPPPHSQERLRQESAFDPWRFGTLALPPDLRREILATRLPAIPSDRLYASSSRAARLGPWRRFVLCAVVVTALACAIYWVFT